VQENFRFKSNMDTLIYSEIRVSTKIRP